MRPTPSLLLLVLLAGCGQVGDTDSGRSSSPGATPSDDREHAAVGTVLDAGDGPVLCLGGVAESLPPQCDGPPVEGWSWSDVEHESASGVQWGEYAVRGRWDGEVFTVTAARAPREADWAAGASASEELATPCREPAGGWASAPPDGWDDAGFQRALVLADGLDGVGRVWGDDGAGSGGGFEGGDPTPERLVLNVAVTGGAAARDAAERRLRATYDGDVCVSAAAYSRARLEEVQRELHDRRDELGVLSSSVDRAVEVLVVHDDGALQAELDETYGAGVVSVASALRPVR